jgi:2-polyprenyl-3-methyl-5-hydroxy-6-metoxy-1,4-benzoquinol methylase
MATSRFHEANRRRWDAASASWAHRADTGGIWKRCHRDPSLAMHSAELKWLNDVTGKRVAVLGSGDNQVVFALAGMGAKVTSIDISEPQLEIARSRAAVLSLTVQFVRADVVDLSCLSDDTTIVGTINPAHLQTNLEILQQGPLPPDLYEEAKERLAAAGSAPRAGAE